MNTSKLRRYNIIAGVFHLVQMIAVLALANDFTLPIVARYMSGPPGSTFAEPITLFDTPVGLGVALFLGLSAFFHFLVVSPKFFPRYSAGLAQNRNYFRWVEYSISSSVMLVIIAQICGVSDIVALIAIFGVNASMILFGTPQRGFHLDGFLVMCTSLPLCFLASYFVIRFIDHPIQRIRARVKKRLRSTEASPP